MNNCNLNFSVLCKVKVRLLNTVIRLEHLPLGSTTGVALELRIKNLEYSDEAGSDPSNVNLDPNQQSKGYVIPVFMTKRFYFEGMTFHSDEFLSKARTSSRSRCSTPDSKVFLKICKAYNLCGSECMHKVLLITISN